MVNAPTEMTSTPASASSRTRPEATPPDTSTTARPSMPSIAGRRSAYPCCRAGRRWRRRRGLAAAGRARRSRPRARAGARARRAPADRGGDTAGGGDVVVLDHRAVEQAEAVRRPPPCDHGLLLERAQAGSRLARRGDARRGAGGLGDVGGRQRRDAAQAAQEVQCVRRPRRSPPADRAAGDDVTGPEAVAVGAGRKPSGERWVELGGAPRGGHAESTPPSRAITWRGPHRRRRCGDVAEAGEVLGQRAPDHHAAAVGVALAGAAHSSAPCSRAPTALSARVAHADAAGAVLLRDAQRDMPCANARRPPPGSRRAGALRATLRASAPSWRSEYPT